MARHVLLVKSHVSAFTRKDGTFVAAHDDKRTAADKPTAKAKPAKKPESSTKSHGSIQFTRKDSQGNIDHLRITDKSVNKVGDPMVIGCIPDNKNLKKGDPVSGQRQSLSNFMFNSQSRAGYDGQEQELRDSLREAYQSSKGHPDKVLAALRKTTRLNDWEVHHHEPAKKSDA